MLKLSISVIGSCLFLFLAQAARAHDSSAVEVLSNSEARKILAKYDDQQIKESYSGIVYYTLPGQGIVLQSKATALSNDGSSHSSAVKIGSIELAKVTLDNSVQGQQVQNEYSRRRTSQRSSTIVYPNNDHVYIDLFCQPNSLGTVSCIGSDLETDASIKELNSECKGFCLPREIIPFATLRSEAATESDLIAAATYSLSLKTIEQSESFLETLSKVQAGTKLESLLDGEKITPRAEEVSQVLSDLNRLQRWDQGSPVPQEVYDKIVEIEAAGRALSKIEQSEN